MTQVESLIQINRNLQPRHPHNRNARLHRFARDWLEYNLPNEKQRSRIRERLEHWGVRLQRAYNREQCGYFDPGSPNAADPNPDVNQKLNKSRKSRARRDIDDYDEWMADYEAGGLEIMGNSDVAADQIAVRGRKDMIFQNPEKAIKNILRGYQNYARRYIAGCHGERVNQIHSKRAKKMTTRLLNLYRENLNS